MRILWLLLRVFNGFILYYGANKWWTGSAGMQLAPTFGDETKIWQWRRSHDMRSFWKRFLETVFGDDCTSQPNKVLFDSFHPWAFVAPLLFFVSTHHILFEARLRSLHNALSAHHPAPSRRMIGEFRFIDTLRFLFEFFQIRTYPPLAGNYPNCT